jgi:hypothetical protein
MEENDFPTTTVTQSKYMLRCIEIFCDVSQRSECKNTPVFSLHKFTTALAS